MRDSWKSVLTSYEASSARQSGSGGGDIPGYPMCNSFSATQVAATPARGCYHQSPEGDLAMLVGAISIAGRRCFTLGTWVYSRL
jgi:hypothetical protein